jgi:hypothetical protein
MSARNIRLSIWRASISLAILAAISLFAIRPCFADQFNYIVSDSISQITVGSGAVALLGTVTGDFTINTTNVPFNYNYGAGVGTPDYTYYCSGEPTCPFVQSASLTWTPVGGSSQYLEVSPYVTTLLGANDGWDGVGECAFISGEACNFQLGAAGSNIGGFLDFYGTLGQNLSGPPETLCVVCFGSSSSGPSYALQEGTAMVTPEPGTLVLTSCGLMMLLVLRRILPRPRAD